MYTVSVDINNKASHISICNFADRYFHPSIHASLNACMHIDTNGNIYAYTHMHTCMHT